VRPPAAEPAGASRPTEPAPQAHRVRPLDLPSAQPRPPVAARIAPLSLPENARLPPASRSPVQPLVLPALPTAVPSADRYAPASLLFDEGQGSAIERLKRRAVETFPAIAARQLEALDEAIRELLPVEVSNLAAWGTTLLRRTESLSGELQRLTAAVASWQAGDLIEKCHLSMNASAVWKIFRRNSPASLKPALELVLSQAPQTLAALDELARRLAPCRDAFAASLLLLKVAPQVLVLRDIEAEALARRGHLLSLSAQHFELLEPQLEQLRRQVLTWQSEIEQLARVSIPLWELANRKAPG
jgi:hypothetical protein